MADTPDWDKVAEEASKNVTPFLVMKQAMFTLFSEVYNQGYPPEYVLAMVVDVLRGASGLPMPAMIEMLFQEWRRERNV